ncbi:MAG: hypothetical protein AAGG51_28460 [Cyanobacteria bacterium P01_G01_bin.54]
MFVSDRSPQQMPPLSVGVHWRSFEQFRQQGAKALSDVKQGTTATLHTKTGQYRVIEEQDFQALYGLARDVDRLRGGMRVVMLAARLAQKHPEQDAIELLTTVAAMLGEMPELPTRSEFESIELDASELDEADEVLLDPSEIERPV